MVESSQDLDIASREKEKPLTRFERNTVVTIDDDRVFDSDAVAAVGVPTIRIGCEVVVCRYRVNGDIVIYDIFALVDLRIEQL